MDGQVENAEERYESILNSLAQVTGGTDADALGFSDEEDEEDEEAIGQMMAELYKKGLTTSADPDAELTEEGIQFLTDAIMGFYMGLENDSAFEPGCSAYVLRVYFLYEYVETWREFKVPLDITFHDLHCLIQALFGWHNREDYHFVYKTKDDRLHCIAMPTGSDEQFMYRAGMYVDRSLDATEDWRDARDVCLFTVMPIMDRLAYVYDYQDKWQIGIDLVGKDTLEDGRAVTTGGYGPVPPEGVGGEEAFFDLVDVLTESDGEEFEEAADWALDRNFEPDYDPEACDTRLRAWKAVLMDASVPSERDELFCENAKYLGVFVRHLMDQGLANKTVDDQSDEIDYYLNNYLCWHRGLSMEEGAGEVAEYLGNYLLGIPYFLPSLTAFRTKMTSIKKFYKLMYELGFVEREDYQGVLKTIKENQNDWLDYIKKNRW